jgi:protein-tyrosine phosphatase
MQGVVRIFESSHPDSFNLSSPIAEVDIGRGFRDIVLIRPVKRSYFRLVFNKNYSTTTAARVFPMEELFNFRDFGGYYNTNGKQIRWGKLYSSSSLSNISLQDVNVLNNLGIQTVFDLRPNRESFLEPAKYFAPQTVYLPLRGNPYNIFFDTILREEMMAGDVKLYAQDIFFYLLDHNPDYFVKMFDLLSDENSYPVLFTCTWGSDRSAIVAALILAALDIDLEQIFSDYMLTNEQINIHSLIQDMDIYSQVETIQETLTALVRVHKSTVTYSFDRIIKEYGSMDNYFVKELDLTANKREKLKKILLY